MWATLAILARYCPLLAVASLSVSVLPILNPSLFWDDWVWPFQRPEALIRIGVEMGAWWGGYLSNLIYGLPNPTLALRITAFVAWLGAGGAAAYVLHRLAILSGRDAVLLFALYAACHVGLIRFLNSVAMYNVYIASFWLGWALLIDARRRSAARKLAAAALFLFSFNLSSMLVLYGLVLLWVGADTLRQGGGRLCWPARELDGGRPTLRAAASGVLRANRDSLTLLGRWSIGWLLLPVLFVLIVKVPSYVLLKTSATPLSFYSGYNAFGPLSLITAIPTTLLAIPRVIWGSVRIAWEARPSGLLAGYFALYLGLLYLLPGRVVRSSWRDIALMGVAGFALAVLGTYPYAVVGKPPVVSDFYDSRHVLAALPGIVLILLAAVKVGAILVPRRAPRLSGLVHNSLLAALLALSSSYGFVVGADLVKDWLRQDAITRYVAAHATAISGFGLIVFDDKTEGLRIGNRYVWNYEYTGNILKATGQQTHLGISLHEYQGAPVGERFFVDRRILARYNAAEFDFGAPHLVLTLTNGIDRLRGRDLLGALADQWAGRPLRPSLSDLVRFAPAIEYREAPERMAAMARIVAALDAYRRDHGRYPVAPTGAGPGPSGFGPLPAVALSGSRRQAADTWMTEVAPRYLAEAALKLDCDPGECGFRYVSDGTDYKLVFVGARDLPYARQAFGANMDPRPGDRAKAAYGYWTEGAAQW